jgi:hypothetical protein
MRTSRRAVLTTGFAGPGGWLGAAGSPRVGRFDAFRVVPIELRDEVVNLATGEAAA